MLRNVLILLYKKAFVDQALFSHDLQDFESNGVVINGQFMYENATNLFFLAITYAVIRGSFRHQAYSLSPVKV